MAIFKTGIVYFTYGEKQVGLYLLNNMNPEEVGLTVFEFVEKLKDQKFLNSVKEYVKNIEVVKFNSPVSQEIRNTLSLLHEQSTWLDITESYYNQNANIPLQMFFELRFNQLLNVSRIMASDISDAENVNHIYEINLNDHELAYSYGGLNYDIYWKETFRERFYEIIIPKKEQVLFTLHRRKNNRGDITLEIIIKYFFKDNTIFISGGYGESFEDRIIIDRAIDNDFIGDEYKILEYLTVIKGGYTFVMVQQSLRRIENCTLDILELNFYIKDKDGEERVENATMYFDITNCFGKE